MLPLLLLVFSVVLLRSATGSTGASPDLAISSSDLATSSPDLAISSPDLAISSPDLATSSPDLATASPDLATASSDLATSSPDLAISSPDLAAASRGIVTGLFSGLANACLEGAGQSGVEELRNDQNRSTEEIKAELFELAAGLTNGQQRLQQQMTALQDQLTSDRQHLRQQMTTLQDQHQQQMTALRDQLTSDQQQQMTAMRDQLTSIQKGLTRTAPEDCPATWSRRGSNCYLIPALKTSWEAAHQACLAFDRRARLASVHRATSRHITSMVAKSGGSSWIGLFQSIQTGYRLWGWTDGSPLDYTNWAPGEPDYKSGGLLFTAEQHCALMENTGTWDDEECDANKRFVCQITLG